VLRRRVSLQRLAPARQAAVELYEFGGGFARARFNAGPENLYDEPESPREMLRKKQGYKVKKKKDIGDMVNTRKAEIAQEGGGKTNQKNTSSSCSFLILAFFFQGEVRLICWSSMRYMKKSRHSRKSALPNRCEAEPWPASLAPHCDGFPATLCRRRRTRAHLP